MLYYFHKYALIKISRYFRVLGFCRFGLTARYTETVSGRSATGKKGICMAVKLYVGNLPYTTTEEDLRQLFAEHGEVESVAVITDRETGRSKGFGFAEMSDDEAAKKAIEALNGKEFGGRNLVVNEARPREERPRDGGGAPRGGNGGGFRQRSW